MKIDMLLNTDAMHRTEEPIHRGHGMFIPLATLETDSLSYSIHCIRIINSKLYL